MMVSNRPRVYHFYCVHLVLSSSQKLNFIKSNFNQYLTSLIYLLLYFQIFQYLCNWNLSLLSHILAFFDCYLLHRFKVNFKLNQRNQISCLLKYFLAFYFLFHHHHHLSLILTNYFLNFVFVPIFQRKYSKCFVNVFLIIILLKQN